MTSWLTYLIGRDSPQRSFRCLDSLYPLPQHSLISWSQEFSLNFRFDLVWIRSRTKQPISMSGICPCHLISGESWFRFGPLKIWFSEFGLVSNLKIVFDWVLFELWVSSHTGVLPARCRLPVRTISPQTFCPQAVLHRGSAHSHNFWPIFPLKHASHSLWLLRHPGHVLHLTIFLFWGFLALARTAYLDQSWTFDQVLSVIRAHQLKLRPSLPFCLKSLRSTSTKS